MYTVAVSSVRPHSLELLPHGQVGRGEGKGHRWPCLFYDFHKEVQTFPARRVETGAKGGLYAKKMLSSLYPLHLILTWHLDRSLLLVMPLSGFAAAEGGLLVQHVLCWVRS